MDDPDKTLKINSLTAQLNSIPVPVDRNLSIQMSIPHDNVTRIVSSSRFLGCIKSRSYGTGSSGILLSP